MTKKLDEIAKALRRFGGWENRALDKTLAKMRGMGLIDHKLKCCKLDEERTVELFDVYYRHFLEKEKKVPLAPSIGNIIGGIFS